MSEFSRETLLNIIETDHVQCGEASALARMALSAMDSESWCLPLDYLQGHKDGLEWASQLAEANHPETGDWLYDDPIELAKAIRKGPDMTPAQPVADSEPDRNPVLAYADSYRDMAKQGVESVPIWSVITDLERNIAPLYRHAQPVPLVSEVSPLVSEQPAPIVQPMMFIDGDISSEDADKLAKVIRDFNEEDERPLAKMARIIRENPHPTNECDMPKAQPAPVVYSDFESFWSSYIHPLAQDDELKGFAWDIWCAAMLQAGTLTNEDTKQAWTGIPDIDNAINTLDRIDTLESCDDDRIEAVKTVLRGLAGNSPVITDSSADMLRRWLAFGRGMQNAGSQLPHNLIAETESMLAAAPQSPGIEPATVPGKWIPVSERMPEVGDIVLTAMGGAVNVGEMECSAANCRFFTSVISGRELPATHWMPLPAAPQEAQGE